MKALILILISTLIGCASTPTQHIAGAVSESDYNSMYKRNTRKANQYDGFYQTFQADVTLLSTDLRTAGVARQADYLQWDADRLQKERDSEFQKMAGQTEFFMRFFTPDGDNDNIGMAKSIWRVYLEVGGKRYEGDAKKLTENMTELKNLYPGMDRFSTPYLISFKVPTQAVETASAKVVLTGQLGKAEFDFAATK